MAIRTLPPFFQVENELYQDEGHPLKLIWTWRKVAIYLREAASHDENNAAFRSIPQICEQTDLSRKQVTGAIDKLLTWPSKDAPFLLDWNRQDNFFILRPLPAEHLFHVQRWFWELQAADPKDRDMLDFIKDVFCFVRSQFAFTTANGTRIFRCSLDGKKLPSIAFYCETRRKDRSQRIRQAVEFLHRHGILKEVKGAKAQPARIALCKDMSDSVKLPTILSTSDIRNPNEAATRDPSLSLGAVAPFPRCSSASAAERPSVQYRTSLGAVAPSSGAVAPFPRCSSALPSVQYARRTQEPNEKPDGRTPKAPRLRRESTSATVVLENEAGDIPTSEVEFSSATDVLEFETEVIPTSATDTVETSTEEKEVNHTPANQELAAIEMLIQKGKERDKKIELLEAENKLLKSQSKEGSAPLSNHLSRKKIQQLEEEVEAETARLHDSLGLTAKERFSYDEEEEKERKEEEKRTLIVEKLLQRIQEELHLPESSESLSLLAKEFRDKVNYRITSLFKEAGIPVPPSKARCAILKAAIRSEFHSSVALGGIFCHHTNLDRLLQRLWNGTSSCLIYSRVDQYESAAKQLFRDLAHQFPPQHRFGDNDPRNQDPQNNLISKLTYSQFQQLPALAASIPDEILKHSLFGEDTTEQELHHLRNLLLAEVAKEVREQEEIHKRTTPQPIDPQAPAAAIAPAAAGVPVATPKLGPKKSIPTAEDILIANQIAGIIEDGESLLDSADSTDPTETDLAEPEEDEDDDDQVLDVDLDEDDFEVADGMSDDGDDEEEGWVDHHVATRAPHDPKPENPPKQFRTPSKPKQSNDWKVVFDEIRNRRSSK